jgi:hypothetical protein
MEKLFEVMVPLGMGVLFSPEIFLLGLFIASCREDARKKAWIFAAAATFGVLFFLLIGLLFEGTTPHGPSTARFLMRAVLGTAFFILGIHVLVKKSGPISSERIAKGVSLKTAALLGLAVTGMNLKAISLSLEAGHEISSSSLPLSARAAGLGVYFGLCLIPIIVAAALETIKRGLVAGIMGPCLRLMHNYGRIVGAAIFFVIGAVMWKNAISVMP